MEHFTSKVEKTSVDPFKHVNYVYGMVLGVDDFEQEFSYLSHRDQWLARDVLGYGTVCGLQVTVTGTQEKPQIEVSPGTALTPKGQLVRVDARQCAQLNDWLVSPEGKKALETYSTSSPILFPPNPLELYVVLCYRSCETDKVPIPGEPCRSDDESMAPSRITDSFKLELRTTPPDHAEEAAIRDFVAWLAQVEIGAGPSIPIEVFLNALRGASQPTSPPSSPPDFMYGSPLDSSLSPVGPFQIAEEDAPDYLRAAFLLWTTELRPRWRDGNHTGNPSNSDACDTCSGNPPDEQCVLLARVDVPVVQNAGVWTIDGTINLDETNRPYLLSLRLLQEWLLYGLRGVRGAETLAGEVTGPVSDTKVSKIQGIGVVAASSPLAGAEGDVLTIVGGEWQAATPIGPSPMILDGDATGPTAANTVERIRNVVVEPGIPTSGQVLGAVDVGGEIHWRATDLPLSQSGPFVQHPKTLEGFGIVAAGIIRLNEPRFRPVFPEDLRLESPGFPGAVIVRFDGYTNPSGRRFQYIIKAMPMPFLETEVISDGVLVNPDALNNSAPITVNFLGFTEEGIWLAVFQDNKPLEDFDRLVLVVEISRFPFKQ